MTPTTTGLKAVRSSGCSNTGGLSVWAQYCTYIAGCGNSGKGGLIQHNVFAESATRAH
ncbi:hypothetical protein MSIMFI_02300 [Mycobacterium simulans]|uniref:hypothetical protein n=1 Tax=Mycobacterium simulans TaxID=627089 RepID=UPI00174E7199|nr:hypothetical protein [Mycobacterium simulans]SON60799.1 hypothetical protein MSIMFI_02300 [Mycobacterium simulans]